MLHDLIIILLTWLLSYQLVMVALPYVLASPLKNLPDMGWGFTRVIGWIMVGLAVWFLAYLGIPINTMTGVYLVFLAWLIGGVLIYQRQGQNWWEKLKSVKTLILIEEGLFLFGLIYLSITRGFMPDINGLEKFMDAGLINKYLVTARLPLPDMWLAGYNFNYYTFGHFLGSIALRFFHQDLAVGYNLLLAFLMGLMLTQAFALTAAFLGKSKKQIAIIIAGLMAAFVITFGGNTHAFWYLLSKHSFAGYWYPDATRFIENTIHEFPSYSYIVSDLHAHTWSMVLVFVTMVLFLTWAKLMNKNQAAKKSSTWAEKYQVWAVFSGVMLGVLASTSTWDLLIYGTLLAIFGFFLLVFSKGKLLVPLIVSALLVGIACLITMSPWWLNFNSISEGVRLVTTRSELWRFLVLWTGHILVSGLALGWAARNMLSKPEKTERIKLIFIIAVVCAAWGLLLLPELIYFKDIYPSHPRANTMFKLTFQGFILMGLAASWAMGHILSTQNIWRQKQKFLLVPLVVFVFVVGLYPYFGYRDYYNGWREYKGLDGLTWLKRDNPDDYAAMMWLKESALPNQIIVEAVGESYTTFARVSTFTQLGTILGWRVHEWLWRGSFDIPGQRTPEVQNIYEKPLSAEAMQKLREYKVTYIFVGDKEYEAYPNLDAADIKRLGQVVFEKNRTFVVQLPALN